MSAPRAVKVTPSQWTRAFSEHSACPRAHRLVLWELAAFADAKGEWARPGVRLLADRVGLKKDDTISPALEWGRRNYWIRRTMKGNYAKKQADVYCLVVPARFATPAEMPEPDTGTHTRRAGTGSLGGLTLRQTEEVLRLQSEEDEYLAKGNPYGMPKKDFKRMQKLWTLHRTWQVEVGEWPPRSSPS